MVAITRPEESCRRKFDVDTRVCLVALQKQFNFVVEILHWLIDHIYSHYLTETGTSNSIFQETSFMLCGLIQLKFLDLLRYILDMIINMFPRLQSLGRI